MSEKEDKVHERIEREKERIIKEDKSDHSRYQEDRDIVKMQDPGNWPDPPDQGSESPAEKKESDS